MIEPVFHLCFIVYCFETLNILIRVLDVNAVLINVNLCDRRFAIGKQ